jgi:hypothetical protein
MRKYLVIIMLLLFGAGALWRVEYKKYSVTDFASCASQGYPIRESYPRQCAMPDGAIFREQIGNADAKKDLIRVTSIPENKGVASPLYIAGEARGTWFFEGSFPVTLLDANGKEITRGHAESDRSWMTTDFVPFSLLLAFDPATSTAGTLILKKDNPSGLPEKDDALIIPVTFEQKQGDTQTVTVFFGNTNLNPGLEDCTKVFPVERVIPKTEGVARAAITELLKGTTNEEEAQGYFSSINGGSQIKSLTIEKETAHIDFDSQMQYEVGGSCRVSGIRNQIIQTLKQFPTIKNVVISVEGNSEEALQP